MGHAKVDTTLNVYTQVVDGSLRGAADTVGSEWVTIVHKPEKTMLGHAEGGRRAERGQEIQSQKREGTRNKRRAFLARRTGRFPTLAGPEGRLSLDMRLTCTHACRMSKMVQIRNVPDALHRKLKVRAANSGQTLSDYLLAELERLAARPTRHEMLTRIHGRKRVTLKTPAATVIREERESA